MSETQPRESFVKNQYEAFLAAVQFLTRIPITLRLVPDLPERYQATLARGVIYFPLVGGLITAATSLVILLLWMGLGLPIELAVVIGLAFEAMLTGALHEDALADTCDALGGGWTRQQILEILKDSRLGTYGTLGLTLGLMCRFFCLVALAQERYEVLVIALVASGAIGRWAMLWLMHTLAPIGDRQTLAHAVAGPKTGPAIVYAAILGLPAVVAWLAIDPVGVVIALAASGGGLVFYRLLVLRRVGGSTGDLLGCSGYLVQLIVLLVAVSRFGQ